MFPVANSPQEVLDGLQTNKAVFIDNERVAELGLQAFKFSSETFDEQQLSLDSKTMFPIEIAFLAGVKRQVIQHYIVKPNNIVSSDLSFVMSQLELEIDNIVLDILFAAAAQFNWDSYTKTAIIDPTEWTLNIAKYPFTEYQDDKLLFPAHKDWGMLAIYPYVAGPGLEAMVDGNWIPVEIPNNYLFCYAGDIFSKLTDNKIPALTHRVRQPKGIKGSRTSIIFYVDPARYIVLPSGERVGDIINSKLRKIEQIK